MSKKLFPETVDDILADPSQYGLPTFEQFAKNPEAYIGKEDEKLAFADAGSTILKNYVQRHIYEIDGYPCKSLVEVERIAKSQGYNLRELEYTLDILPNVGQKCDILIKFHKKPPKGKNSNAILG